jgi:hypothetical protein
LTSHPDVALTRTHTLQESIPVLELVREMGAIMQEFTQSGGVRPFGVSLLIAGCVAKEEGRPGRPPRRRAEGRSPAYSPPRATAAATTTACAASQLRR